MRRSQPLVPCLSSMGASVPDTQSGRARGEMEVRYRLLRLPIMMLRRVTQRERDMGWQRRFYACMRLLPCTQDVCAIGCAMGIMVSGLVECLIADCVNHDLYSLSRSLSQAPAKASSQAPPAALPPSSPDRLGFSFSSGSTCSRLTLTLRT